MLSSNIFKIKKYIMNDNGPKVDYYQHKINKSVIGVIGTEYYFNYYSDTKEFNLNELSDQSALFLSNYKKIIPPKFGDKIKLMECTQSYKQRIIPGSYDVISALGYRIMVSPPKSRDYITIDIRDWIWENETVAYVEPEPVAIKDGDIITQNGKQYLITLTEVTTPKYKVGDIVFSCVVVDTKYTENGWLYTLYKQKISKIVEVHESRLYEYCSLYSARE